MKDGTKENDEYSVSILEGIVDGDGDAKGDCDGDGDAKGDCDGDGDAKGDCDGDVDAKVDGDGDVDAKVDGDGDAKGDCDVDAKVDGEVIGEGGGNRTLGKATLIMIRIIRIKISVLNKLSKRIHNIFFIYFFTS